LQRIFGLFCFFGFAAFTVESSHSSRAPKILTGTAKNAAVDFWRRPIAAAHGLREQ
jgi:hypothetical protein